jgi:hypothetical protein
MEHRPEIGRFCFCCKMCDRKTWNYVELFCRFCFYMWSRMDVMNFTRHVVAWHARCQSPIGSYRLLGGNMLTRGIFTSGIFWSDGPRLPSFDRTAHQYAKLKKKVTNWAGICWHVACWHVVDFDRTVHVYRAGTCHVEMINRVKKYVCRVRFVIFVFPRFHVWNPGFLFLKSAFFFSCLSRPQDCSDCDLELQTVSLAELPQHLGKFLREWAGLPRMTSVNCSLVDTVLKPTQHATWQKLTYGITWLVHVASSATWQALIGPYHFWYL